MGNEVPLHKDGDGETPLHILCKPKTKNKRASWGASCPGIARRLLSGNNGTLANVPDLRGSLPLHIACHRDSKSLFEILVSHTKDLNSRNGSGRSAIELAVLDGRIEYVRILLATGRINLSDRDNGGMTVFSTAVISDASTEILQLLSEAFAPIAQLADENDERLTPLHHALAKDSTAAIEFILGLPNFEQIFDRFMQNGGGRDDGAVARLCNLAEERGLEGAVATLDRFLSTVP